MTVVTSKSAVRRSDNSARTSRTRGLLAAFVLCLGWTSAQAAWPERPVTIVVPAAAGGTTDIAARLVAVQASQIFGQPFVVENRAGGGGIIGTQRVAQSKADGYTLLMGNVGPNAINYSLYKALPYKFQDFAAISLVVMVPNVLVVNASSPVKSVSELVQAIKKDPQKSNFGSSGIGQSPHMTTEMFKQRTSVEAVHIPFPGSAPAVTALLGDQFLFMFDNLPASMPHIRSGKFRALAVSSAQRAPALPDIPTLGEAGVPDMVVNSWFGLFAPAGVPQAVIDKLGESVSKIVQLPEVSGKLRDLGGVPVGNRPAEFEKFVADERQRWKQTVERAGITLEHQGN